MYAFIMLLLLGFALAAASAFTAAYSRLWGERGGQCATVLLRNVLGIPLWFLGFGLAWIRPASFLLAPRPLTQALGGLLIVSGAVPALWGHLQLGWRTHMPSMSDNWYAMGSTPTCATPSMRACSWSLRALPCSGQHGPWS